MPPVAFDKTVPVTALSIAAPRIELIGENGSTLAKASAAFYRGIDGIYLVTNWHNLAGVDALTGSYMSGFGSFPASVRIVGRHMRDPIWNVPHVFEISLRDPETGRFVWRQHPIHGRMVDVGALKLPDHLSASVKCCNDDLRPYPVAICPGDEVFILGYPLNISGGLNYPVWKRGSIASEPSEDIGGLPKYLIDSASRKGMSGAPVFFRSHVYLSEGGRLAVGKTAQLFYGIYSGRIPESGDGPNDLMAAQIGTVWKPIAVEEVVSNGVEPEL